MFTKTDITTFLLTNPYAQGTQEAYTMWLTSLLSWVGSNNVEPEEMNLIHVRNWMDSQAWCTNTRYGASCAVRGFFRWFYGERHPLAKLKMRKDKPSPQRTLETEEVKRIFAYFDLETLKGIRDRAMFAFFIDTGVRSSELASLTVDNLKLSRCAAVVLTKGGEWQEKVYSEQTAAILRLWLTYRNDIVAPGVNRLFCSIRGIKPGRPLTVSGLRVIFRKISFEAGISHFTPHALRRTMATLSILNGAPTRLVQLQGGWKDIKMVERYTQKLKATDFQGYFPITTEIISSVHPSRHPRLQLWDLTYQMHEAIDMVQDEAKVYKVAPQECDCCGKSGAAILSVWFEGEESMTTIVTHDIQCTRLLIANEIFIYTGNMPLMVDDLPGATL